MSEALYACRFVDVCTSMIAVTSIRFALARGRGSGESGIGIVNCSVDRRREAEMSKKANMRNVRAYALVFG